MANKMTWKFNIISPSAQPLIMPGNFQAGDTQAVERGDIIELTAGGATQWVPIDSDFNMNGDIAVSDADIDGGDRAGYYPIIVPRPGDVFEYELASADNPSIGTALYYNAAQKVTTTAGTNILARVYSFDHYPRMQGHLSRDASTDEGTTLRNTTFLLMMFDPDASYFKKMYPVT